MSSELATMTAAVESVLIQGDLSKLTADQRIQYYRAVCESVGLNPLTKPFDYLSLSGRLVLYAKRDATDQLRKIHGVSVRITGRENIDGVYVVSASATDRSGRTDESTGAVTVANLKGDNLANAFMKAETKAKRRVTLSICGLGLLDETEVETIHDARPHVEPEAPARPALPANGKPGGQHESPAQDGEEQFAKFRQAMKDCQTREEVRTVGQLVKASKGKLSTVHVEMLRADAEKRLAEIDEMAEAAAVAADNSDVPVG